MYFYHTVTQFPKNFRKKIPFILEGYLYAYDEYKIFTVF